MAFTSLSFLFLFLPPFFLLYFLSQRNGFKNLVLSAFSLIFLIWAGPYNSLLLLSCVLINWISGIYISKIVTGNKRKSIFTLTLILNLLPLFLFKYTDFLIENLNPVLRIAGLTGIKIPDWILPLGISFYSFRLISYQIELYRKKVPVAGNFIHLFLYTAFFPHLGAGPIVRYHEFYHRIYSKKLSLSGFSSGLQRFILGLVKKAVIANNLGIVADSVFNIPGDDLSLSTAWLGVLSYTFQVYYDFSGYSDMAIGLSRMAGFNTPENFNFPYKALSVKDFWKRWHMT